MHRRAKIRWLSYAVALAAVLFTALAACHVGANGYTTRIDAQSTRAFGEALSAVERLDRSLKKSPLAVGAPMECAVCMEIYADARSAQTALSALPVELDTLEQISRHLSVAGDYAFSLAGAASRGESFSEDTLSQLADFSAATGKLLEQLEILRGAFQSGAVIPEHYDRLTDALTNLEEETEQAADTLESELHALAEGFPASASLVYDGQYCDHSGETPRMLEGKDSVSEDDARSRAASFLQCDPTDLSPLGKTGGDLPCWRFSLGEGGETVIAVTEQGGEVLRVLSGTQNSGEIDREATEAAAKQFLSEHGYGDVAAVQTSPDADAATLTFVPVQDGVLCLPDRVSLRLDASGKLISYDASCYLKYHHDRDLSAAEKPSDLRSALPEGVSVTGEQTVILLSPGGQERFCKAYACQTADGDTATIFINLLTGQQERILLGGERVQPVG